MLLNRCHNPPWRKNDVISVRPPWRQISAGMNAHARAISGGRIEATKLTAVTIPASVHVTHGVP
jgi:hypothetical protein